MNKRISSFNEMAKSMEEKDKVSQLR